jgi:hypothetical protein
MSGDQFPSVGIWEKLSQVAVKGAAHDSPERPHVECSDGTRVAILNRIDGLLDCRENNQLIWLHGIAGVGKSVVAFTIAERMRGLKMTKDTIIEKRLAGTFFFPRKHTRRCTTGYFFATLAYQLGCRFPSIQGYLKHTIYHHPALLDPSWSLRDQMEKLFLQSLQQLQTRLKGCPPLVFVVDALDETESATELISLLGEALHKPDLPKTHILITSRSQEHIRKAIQKEEQRRSISETPFGEVIIISLDDAYVDGDISVFFHGFFNELQPNFPLASGDQVAQLTSRAGRRFVVASTITKFIDDKGDDPGDRLQLILELTSDLLPVTEIYKLYDRILSTCDDDVKQAYSLLSIVAALADPLPISQISNLLGQGKDAEAMLLQLLPFMNIPSDSSHPMDIYHSSVRDYVSDPSNCSLAEVRDITPPHSLLADSCLCLMMRDSSNTNTSLLDELSKLERQRQATESKKPMDIKLSLPFLVQPPEPLQVLIALLWHRGHYRSDLYPWLESPDGHAWLQTSDGQDWLRTQEGKDWQSAQEGSACLQTDNQGDRAYVQTESGREWVQAENLQEQLHTLGGQQFLQTARGGEWLRTQTGLEWLQILSGREWLSTQDGQEWLQTRGGREWLQTPNGREWLQTSGGREWLQMQDGQDWLQSQGGQELLQTQSGREWLQTSGGQEWLQTQNGQAWLQTPQGQAWQTPPTASVLAIMEEFTSAFEAISQHINIPASPTPPAFQAIQQFKDLPDFLMFPAFLALRHKDRYTSTLPPGPFLDIEIIRDMITFTNFGNEVWKRNQSSSDALKYASQNWAFHLSRAPNPWHNKLNFRFKNFWNRHLPSWLERQWSLKGLQPCLVVLSDGQKLAI